MGRKTSPKGSVGSCESLAEACRIATKRKQTCFASVSEGIMNDSEHVRVVCPNCGKRLRLKASLEGKRLSCPSCSALLPGNTEGGSGDEVDTQPGSTIPWGLIGAVSGGVL